jgi:hypothetical protein
MTDTDKRLFDELDQHVSDTHPVWRLLGETFDHRVQSPVEPCSVCGKKVFLLLAKGTDQPVWLQIAEVVGVGTLFPGIQTRRHECGDGESWSVEAALFVESAMAEWGLTPGVRVGGGAG